MTAERQQAHELLDLLPDDKITAVRNLLAAMVEPLARSLAAVPVEEEVLMPETISALNRAKASLASGEGLSHDDILQEFGAEH